MTRAELVKEIATKTGFTQKDVKQVMDALEDVTMTTMPKEEVKIMNGVTLSAAFKEAHTARNPRTGETVTVEGKYSPKCKFGTAVRAAINA